MPTDKKLEGALNVTGQVLSMLAPIIKHFVDQHSRLEDLQKKGRGIPPKEWAKNDADFKQVVADLKKNLGLNQDDEEESEVENDSGDDEAPGSESFA